MPDTLDGRFDSLVLHMALAFHLMNKSPSADLEATKEALLAVMFDDMDANLRELGVGDVALGRRIKEMGRAFCGRAATYAKAFDSREELMFAIEKNLYHGEVPEPENLTRMLDYIVENLALPHIDKFLFSETEKTVY